MVDLIPFPLSSRTSLVRSMVDDLERVHGPAASEFWRRRVAEIIAELRASGLPDGAIRSEIYSLQDAVQAELQYRMRSQTSSGDAA